jgi:short subunit fatty acids transporter
MISKLAKFHWIATQKYGVAKHTKEITRKIIKLSQSIFSYCEYVVVLDAEVHGY